MKLVGHIVRSAVTAMVMGALMLGAPLRAQEPAKGGRAKGGEERGGQPGMAGRRDGREPMGQPQGAAGPLRLLADERVNVQIIPNENGVTILATTEDAELAARIKQELPGQVEAFRNLGQMRNRQGGPDNAARAGGLDPDKVTIEIEPADNGAAIVVSSKDKEQAELIKKIMPRYVEMMRQMGGRGGNMRDRMQGARELLNLLLSENVDVTVEEQDGAVALKLTPKNPEDLEKLMTLLQERVEQLNEMRERMKEMGGEGGIPGVAPGRREGPGGPGMAPGAPGAGGGPGMGPGGAQRGVDPEMRKIIREEIRNYLEEKDKAK